MTQSPFAPPAHARPLVGPLALWIAAALALLALTGLGLQLLHGLASAPGDGPGTVLWRLLRYFTILTNAMVAAGMIAAALGRLGARMAAALTLWIAITGVVFHLLLAGEVPLRGLAFWADVLVHTAVPLGVALWWLALAPKAGLRWRDAAWWLGWPLGYVLYALGRGALDGRYPYFFTDPTRIGWGGVAGWALALALAFWLAGLALVAAARALSRR